jgi:protein tyrosine/serine phosphatase
VKTRNLSAIVAILAVLAAVGVALHLLMPPPPGSIGNGPDGQGESVAVQLTGDARPSSWAQKLEKPGCPNLHKVSGDLYRGAQPTARGMKELKKLGIKTIVNLRSFNSDRSEMKKAGVNFNREHIWMKAWHAEDKEIVRFLKIVNDPAKRPVFVHCQHGADRTGTMCAVYRVAIQGWSKPEALREMTRGGFGYHGVWQNLLRYVTNLDVDKMKRLAGVQ